MSRPQENLAQSHSQQNSSQNHSQQNLSQNHSQQNQGTWRDKHQPTRSRESVESFATRGQRHKVSQRSLQSAPIFRLLLKVAVKGTHQCDFTNFWELSSSNTMARRVAKQIQYPPRHGGSCARKGTELGAVTNDRVACESTRQSLQESTCHTHTFSAFWL